MKYFSRIFRTGAVRRTPEKIIQKILSEIDVRPGTNIIEFGAGNGEITQPLADLSLQQHNVSYYAFEIEKNFAKMLQSLLPSVKVISQDAFHYEKLVPSSFKADYIISSMPLSFYPKAELVLFLQSTRQRLAENGKIIILFHAFWLIPFLKKEFRHCRIHRFATIPPYFLLVFSNKKRNP